MEYIKPEMEWIRFENGDILTDSMPMITFGEGDFDE